MSKHKKRCPEYKRICNAWHREAKHRLPDQWADMIYRLTGDSGVREALASMIWWDYICDTPLSEMREARRLEKLMERHSRNIRPVIDFIPISGAYTPPDRADMIDCMVAMGWPRIVAENRTEPPKPDTRKTFTESAV